MSPAIDEDTTGIRVDCAEKGAERIEQPDDKYSGAERLQVFREEPDPKLLPRADGEGGEEKNPEVTLEGEEIGDALSRVHRP